MRLPQRCLIAIVSSVLLTGCHGLSNNPTSPSDVRPASLTALTLTPVGGGTMLVGGIATITNEGPLPSSGPRLGAFAQFSDGTGMYVTATWTSSDETVILIADNAFRARQTGTVTITATFNGRSDSETFRVEPGVPGLWAGSYVVQQCQASSREMIDAMCSETGNGGRGGTFRVGSTLPIAIDIAQPGIGPEITGAVSLGQARATLNGVNRGAGLFSLAGDLTATGTLVSITHWDARVQQDAMDGFINFRVQFNGVTGVGEVATRLTGVTRQSHAFCCTLRFLVDPSAKGAQNEKDRIQGTGCDWSDCR